MPLLPDEFSGVTTLLRPRKQNVNHSESLLQKPLKLHFVSSFQFILCTNCRSRSMIERSLLPVSDLSVNVFCFRIHCIDLNDI